MIRKKGQTEDFIADLIPSLIIIAIGLYVLSEMHDVGEKAVEETNAKLLEKLEDRKTITDYLAQEIKIDNKKITLNELISLSYKNEEYKKKVKKGLESIRGRGAPDYPADTFCKFRVVCLNAKINYPGDSEPLVIKDEFCAGEEKLVTFPTYEGRYITMNIILGETLDTLRCPVGL